MFVSLVFRPLVRSQPCARCGSPVLRCKEDGDVLVGAMRVHRYQLAALGSRARCLLRINVDYYGIKNVHWVVFRWGCPAEERAISLR